MHRLSSSIALGAAVVLSLAASSIEANPIHQPHPHHHQKEQQQQQQIQTTTSNDNNNVSGSPGCGNHHSFVGSTGTFDFESSGGLRSYRIHLPSTYSPNSPMPLIIAYHGAGSNPESFESKTGLSNESANPDTITVFPAGIDGYWQGPTYAKEGVSDKVFTTDLVNRIKENYCVDESRVYATGMSNGGGFVASLACSPHHGGQFAAFSAVSAAIYTDVDGDEDCHPARSPMPIMETHGTGDDTIPYFGGEGRGGPLPSIPEWVGRWSERNRCSASPLSSLLRSGLEGVLEEVYDCEGREGTVRHVRIDGGAHVYPRPEDEDVDITPVILDWFKKWQRPS